MAKTITKCHTIYVIWVTYCKGFLVTSTVYVEIFIHPDFSKPFDTDSGWNLSYNNLKLVRTAVHIFNMTSCPLITLTLTLTIKRSLNLEPETLTLILQPKSASYLKYFSFTIRVRVSGPTFNTLFMVRVRVRVILNCDVTIICLEWY